MLVPAYAWVQRHHQGEFPKDSRSPTTTESIRRPKSPCHDTDSTAAGTTRRVLSRRLLPSWSKKVYSVMEDAAKGLALETVNKDHDTRVQTTSVEL